jgi:alpha-ketoglutarate-dependent taurine dioxygenase
MPDDVHLSAIGTQQLPLVVEPTLARADLAGWVGAHVAWVGERLSEHGALLFRGFEVDDAQKLERVCRAVASDFPELPEESSPRSPVHGAVWTSTDYAREYPIQFHSEYSYSQAWPLKIFFCCTRPAAAGGETPIADTRRVLRRLAPATRQRFAELQVLYQRNFVEGVGVTWRQALKVQDRAAAEARCRELGMEYEWRSPDWLRTRQRAAAIVRHPHTGEDVWFNHAFFFNVRAIEPVELRQFLLDEPEGDLSTQTFYGDGSPIAPETIEELRAAYAAEAAIFEWRRGDLLLIDNMLAAHARRPYAGERRVLVVMAEAWTRVALSASRPTTTGAVGPAA